MSLRAVEGSVAVGSEEASGGPEPVVSLARRAAPLPTS